MSASLPRAIASETESCSSLAKRRSRTPRVDSSMRHLTWSSLVCRQGPDLRIYPLRQAAFDGRDVARAQLRSRLGQPGSDRCARDTARRVGARSELGNARVGVRAVVHHWKRRSRYGRRAGICRGRAMTSSRETRTKAVLASSASTELWLNAEATALGPGRTCRVPNCAVPMTAMPSALPARWAVLRMALAVPASSAGTRARTKS